MRAPPVDEIVVIEPWDAAIRGAGEEYASGVRIVQLALGVIVVGLAVTCAPVRAQGTSDPQLGDLTEELDSLDEQLERDHQELRSLISELEKSLGDEEADGILGQHTDAAFGVGGALLGALFAYLGVVRTTKRDDRRKALELFYSLLERLEERLNSMRAHLTPEVSRVVEGQPKTSAFDENLQVASSDADAIRSIASHLAGRLKEKDRASVSALTGAADAATGVMKVLRGRGDTVALFERQTVLDASVDKALVQVGRIKTRAAEKLGAPISLAGVDDTGRLRGWRRALRWIPGIK